ncbi:cadmium, cobalt and zinc/H(+)-K(+) antiporter [Geobacter sp. OR-1]|uniref:cation diffusion facilitator family transporter n=1 Tax=Geobacter sp. OR-1 TaxID=1266765 RepID=UPI0005436BD5|nr:cation diffusion facilitator family transporter [Geobacter sp. OR-1]GAM08330.1 cadmium, cobalt and zinc/H(+)-K(+) antiporter [Geobacter sp. OR-1]
MTGINSNISRRLVFAIILTAITLAAEVVGGFWTNSLALLSDAAHVFLDLFALILSLAAIKLSSIPASERHTFGFHRSEVFASFINGLTVFVMALAILYESWIRFAAPETVKSLPMLIVAVIGLVMNLLAAKALHSHSLDDLNVKSAFLHVIGDAAASVGVIVGGIIMYYTSWYLLDALISAAIGLLILTGAGRVLRDSVHILMEGTPRGLELKDVAEAIRTVDGVQDVHHLNIWTVCSHILSLSVHVDIDTDSEIDRTAILHAIEYRLQEQFHITHTTIQMECRSCANGPVIKELNHQPRIACGHRH